MIGLAGVVLLSACKISISQQTSVIAAVRNQQFISAVNHVAKWMGCRRKEMLPNFSSSVSNELSKASLYKVTFKKYRTDPFLGNGN